MWNVSIIIFFQFLIFTRETFTVFLTICEIYEFGKIFIRSTIIDHEVVYIFAHKFHENLIKFHDASVEVQSTISQQCLRHIFCSWAEWRAYADWRRSIPQPFNAICIRE